MPLPRQAWPRIVVSPQAWPNGPGIPSRFRSVAMARDDRLGLIDLAFASNRLAFAVGALHHLITVAEPTAGLALLHPSAQTTMGLGGEVFQEQGVHRAFEADMKFGDFPFGQGDDLHAGKAQMLEQCRHIGLIA